MVPGLLTTTPVLKTAMALDLKSVANQAEILVKQAPEIKKLEIPSEKTEPEPQMIQKSGDQYFPISLQLPAPGDDVAAANAKAAADKNFKNILIVCGCSLAALVLLVFIVKMRS